VVCAPVVEELFYRGLLLRSMERRWGTAVAVVGSSVVFALVHFQPYDLLPLALAGLLFGTLRARSGRLGPGIWAHVAFNLTAIISLLATS
jgi:membrane protease YdiL (CAAX protease family)